MFQGFVFLLEIKLLIEILNLVHINLLNIFDLFRYLGEEIVHTFIEESLVIIALTKSMEHSEGIELADLSQA